MRHLDRVLTSWSSVLALVFAVGCGDDPSGAGGAGGALPSGGGESGGAPHVERVRIFHTSDEEGWIAPDELSEPGTVHGGAAAVLGHMRGEDAFDAELDLLVSSGDNWTGPAVSTWFEGEPSVEVFDAMGYRATAVGNHELDFGLEVLAERVAQASYPHLAANLRLVGSDERPSGLTASRRVVAGGVDVALIGLVGAHMSETATPWSMSTLVVDDPRATLEIEAAAARASGAEIVVALYHGCNWADLLDGMEAEVDLVLGGHCHGARDRVVAGVPFVESGSHFAGYSRVDLELDRATGEVRVAELVYREVSREVGAEPAHPSDEVVEALVEEWVTLVDAALGELVGHSVTGLQHPSWPLANWVTDAWLAAYPEADAAVLNFGALRQALPSGAFDVGDVLGVLPFDNRIVIAELSGAELSAFVAERVAGCPAQGSCYPAVAGMRFDRASDPLVIEIAGASIDPAASYTVLTTDYLFYGGGGAALTELDPDAVHTQVLYRDPPLAWTKALGLDASDPLETHVDPTARDTLSVR